MDIQTTPLVQIKEPLLEQRGVEVWLKREDLNHPLASGNKCRKLKYNLIEAKKQGHTKLLTFGGAYSNHIYAVAGVGKAEGFETIGVIRGEEHVELNPTLQFAKDQGMRFYYMDRSTYRKKESEEVIHLLKQLYGDVYLIPEGGTNELAIKGCTEIVPEISIDYDYLCCPMGTLGTLAGLIIGSTGKGTVLGFSIMKGRFEMDKIYELLTPQQYEAGDFLFIWDYHMGGYAKTKPELFDFMVEFEKKHGILLEPVYTGKMMYGIWQMVRSGFFKPGSKVVAIHTGGLQGRAGFGL